MNILPKKRWHVRTFENMQRVRKDEKEAAEAEKNELDRQKLAEQEHRTRLLRTKAAEKLALDDPFGGRDPFEGGDSSESSAQPSSSSKDQIKFEDKNGHVNFFADLEQQERTFGTNKDAEKDKQGEKEEWEKKIGLLKYLGDGSNEYMKEKVWWQRAPVRSSSGDDQKVTIKSEKTKSKICPPQKLSSSSSLYMPANIMALASGAATNNGNNQSSPVVFPSDLKPSSINHQPLKSTKKMKKKRKKSKKSKKHKKESRKSSKRASSPSSSSERKQKLKKRKHDRNSSSSPSSCDDSEDSDNSSDREEKRRKLAALREQRRLREAEEQMKTRQLFRDLRGEKEVKPEPKMADGRPGKQRYNSQFNPDFAKQNYD